MKRQIKVLIAFLFVFLIIVFAYSGFQIYDTLHNYHVSEEKNNGLSGQFVFPAVTLAPIPEQEQTQQTVEESPISVDFDALLAQSQDVVGWLYCPDTPINYVVAQGSDNDYYLHRFIDGSYSVSGTLFVDWLCSGSFASRNTIIYGHNMKDGSMLACIHNYNDQAYYDSHPVMYLNTPEQDYKLELFAGYITEATDAASYTIGYVDDQSFLLNISQMQARSDFRSDVTITSADSIVTLSTCTYEYNNARYVLVGKLVPIGASGTVPVSDAPVG